jgi:hypothetical protein
VPMSCNSIERRTGRERPREGLVDPTGIAMIILYVCAVFKGSKDLSRLVDLAKPFSFQLRSLYRT